MKKIINVQIHKVELLFGTCAFIYSQEKCISTSLEFNMKKNRIQYEKDNKCPNS